MPKMLPSTSHFTVGQCVWLRERIESSTRHESDTLIFIGMTVLGGRMSKKSGTATSAKPKPVTAWSDAPKRTTRDVQIHVVRDIVGFRLRPVERNYITKLRLVVFVSR